MNIVILFVIAFMHSGQIASMAIVDKHPGVLSMDACKSEGTSMVHDMVGTKTKNGDTFDDVQFVCLKVEQGQHS